MLRPELAATLGADRFLREINIAAQLQQPHILPLLDSGEADGFLYYVMPYVEGESLRDRLARDGALPGSRSGAAARARSWTPSPTPTRGVVHRDIKPDNVLLSGRHALVMDFGVAKAVSEATGRQHAHQRRRRPRHAGVHGAGAGRRRPRTSTTGWTSTPSASLAYEMLTGRTAVHGLTPQQMLAAHVRAAAPRDTLRPAVPPARRSVMMRASPSVPPIGGREPKSCWLSSSRWHAERRDDAGGDSAGRGGACRKGLAAPCVCVARSTCGGGRRSRRDLRGPTPER